MMKKNKSTRFDHKLDSLFWWLVTLLPLILYAFNVFNGGTVDFFTYVSDNFAFSFVSVLFDDVFATFNSFTPLSDFLSYAVSVELIHCLFDIIVFLPRFGRKAIGGVTEL